MSTLNNKTLFVAAAVAVGGTFGGERGADMRARIALCLTPRMMG
jgi:hypothetical protein